MTNPFALGTNPAVTTGPFTEKTVQPTLLHQFPRQERKSVEVKQEYPFNR
jgi:hypothetical protein